MRRRRRGVEPSCVAVFRDELRKLLVPGETVGNPGEGVGSREGRVPRSVKGCVEAARSLARER